MSKEQDEAIFIAYSLGHDKAIKMWEAEKVKMEAKLKECEKALREKS